MTRLGPLFKYFGSKWRGAKHYPAPEYQLIIGACAGGAAYEQHYANREVWLFDPDPEVAALWDYLIHADPAEIRALPCEGLTAGTDIRTLGLSPGGALLLKYWQRTGRSSCWTVSNIVTGENKWCKEHGRGPNAAGSTGMWHPTIRERTAVLIERIRHWKVFQAGYAEIPDVEATYFVDPPYQHQPGVYACWQMDYQHLGAWCKSRRGQVIVCEQEGADWLPFRPLYRVSGMRKMRKAQGVGAAKTQEMIWTNNMHELSMPELIDLLQGSDFEVISEAPATLVPDGAVLIWPSETPAQHGCEAILYQGTQSQCLLIMAAPDVVECLRAA